VNLAPLRFGAGIKGKITDGWWSGTPVITTPIGAEGMSESHPWGGETCSTAEDFAARAVSLYCDEPQWKQGHQNGLYLIRKIYSDEENSKSLIQHLRSLRAGLHQRRKLNLIGSILRHHHHQSTKYFSRWIEEKTKNRESSSPSNS
jgi:hypothetical protein